MKLCSPGTALQNQNQALSQTARQLRKDPSYSLHFYWSVAPSTLNLAADLKRGLDCAFPPAPLLFSGRQGSEELL